MTNLRRAFHFYQPDRVRIVFVLLVLGLNLLFSVLKPWPLALIIDGVLGHKPLPSVAATFLRGWDNTGQLRILICSMLCLYLGQSSLAALQNYLSILIGLRGLNRVRNEVFACLQRLSLRFQPGRQVGDLTYRASTDTYAFQTVFQQGFIAFTASSLSLLLLTVIMWNVNQALTWLALALVPLLVVSMKIFGRQMQARGAEAQKAESAVLTLIQQAMVTLPLVQSYTRERHEEARFRQQTAWSRRKKKAQHGWEVLYGWIVSIGLALGTVALTWLGARQVMAGTLSVGELLVFLAYLTQMFEPLNQLTHVGSTLATATAGIDRVFQVLDTPQEVIEKAHARPVVRASPAAPPSAETVLVRGNLEFDQVSFAYQTGLAVLHDVTFRIAAGQSVGIIGPSGSGKTTLLNLIPRFFDPQEGVVRLEGIDLRELRLTDLRSQVALLLQEPIILPTTVAENISYGRPGATAKETQAAAAAAGALDFIEKLPQKFETLIGEAGIGLSVGEKQRINLARAFLKNAPILLLDEPTSALDAESEAQVMQSLGRLMRERTTVMIAHRLGTVQQLDHLLVLEQGHLTAYGPPRQLAQQEGYYARVVQGQATLG